MISIPIAVNNPLFHWQADLWWWNHQQTYGPGAFDKACLIVIDKNYADEPAAATDWLAEIPHVLCTGVWSTPAHPNTPSLDLPLNIQVGLRQIIDSFADDDVLEVIDCDLFHFRPHPTTDIGDDMLFTCDYYEQWHLHSRTSNRGVIEPYFENGGNYYNGGFVPIIGKARTFKKILYEWEAVHRDLLARPLEQSIHWWAGMFALQAACEKAKVTMVSKDWCYLPGIHTTLQDSHYIGHYSCDEAHFNKRSFPRIDVSNFPDNVFYHRARAWFEHRWCQRELGSGQKITRTAEGRHENASTVSASFGKPQIVVSEQYGRSRLIQRYLNLLEASLTGMLIKDQPFHPGAAGSPFDPNARLLGRDWPSLSFSMIGSVRMRNLRYACETVLLDGVEGDFIETGVWRGGACILMKGILEAYGDSTRRVFVADSFAGLPPPDPENFPADFGDQWYTHAQLRVSRADVTDNFRCFGLLDDRVHFLEGWFKDTLPAAPIDRLAILRLDGDMYESTIQAMNALYHKVSYGGFVIVDDYALPPCAIAIHDFRDRHRITSPILPIDGAGSYWRVDHQPIRLMPPQT